MDTDTEEPYADAEIEDEPEEVEIDEEDEPEPEEGEDLESADAAGEPAVAVMRETQDVSHRVVRVVPEGERRTSNIMSIYELVEAIGIRASQIEHGAPPFVDVTGLDDPIAQARKELFARKTPLILRREVARGPREILVEEWKVREMGFPHAFRAEDLAQIKDVKK